MQTPNHTSPPPGDIASAALAELANDVLSEQHTKAFASGSTLPTVSSQQPLLSRSFIALLAVQFLTALNDNTFRWLAVPLAKTFWGPAAEHTLANDAALLAAGLAGFTLPFMFLTAPAGYLADRFSKSRVISACKLAEMVVMALGFLTIVYGQTALLFVVIAMTGAMNALFAPSRQGSIPELVHEGQLSRANGLMGVATVVPSAMGFLAGNFLASLAAPLPGGQITWLGILPALVFVLCVAMAGWLVSLRIGRVAAADPTREVPWNLFGETVSSLRLLFSDVPLSRAAIGIAFFWSLASLAQSNVDTFAIYDLGLKQWQVGVLGFVLVVGLGAGSWLAGVCSGGRVELGLVPVGAIGIAVCSFVLYFAGVMGERHQIVAFELSLVMFCLLGVFAGLFDVPLEAYLQQRSDPKHLGQVLAATNFLVFTGVMMAAGLFYFLLSVVQVQPEKVFLVAGVGTVPVAVYILVLLPGATFRFLFWLFTHIFYRPKIHGLENIPPTGGALIIANHVSFVDGILLTASIPRPVRFIIFADYVNNPRLNWLAKIFEAIPIKAGAGPKEIVQSLRAARQAIEEGHIVGIFAEGQLTRTGQLQPFQSGFMKIIQGTGAPVIPIYLDGLWGSIFSFRGGKVFWKWPHKIFQRIVMVFGKPMHNVKSPNEVRSQVEQLGVDAVELRKFENETLADRFIDHCQQKRNQLKLADSTGAKLTGGALLAATIVFQRLLARSVFRDQSQVVGLLLPPAAGGILANLATTFSGKVAANLNYTLTDESLNACIVAAGITKVITSRKVLEKRNFQLNAELVCLEDIKETMSRTDKLVAGLGAYVLPRFIVRRWFGAHRVKPDDLLTLIFTSGSTGEPKGVMLTHHNVTATIDSVNHVFQLTAEDMMLGVLPLFHSLGYSITFWLPLTVPPSAVYHVNPLESKVVGQLAADFGVTILLATPTFLRGYLKRCTAEQFSKLDLVVVGAEKLPLDVAHQFQEKFKVLPSEGYGATETTGPAAVNVPDHRCEAVTQRGTKLGTVGRPLPGVAVKVIHSETHEPLPVNTEGIVLLRGGNVMAGYWKQPEKTALVLNDGWYNTGDMGFVDDEGFIHITGRLNRFSKIAGEMVPHLKIEELLLQIIEDPSSTDPELQLAVTAVPDVQKGERLVVVHRTLREPVTEVLKKLGTNNLPNIWLPSADSFVEVEKIPVLGTGKLDLKGLKQLAIDHFGAKTAS